MKRLDIVEALKIAINKENLDNHYTSIRISIARGRKDDMWIFTVNEINKSGINTGRSFSILVEDNRKKTKLGGI